MRDVPRAAFIAAAALCAAALLFLRPGIPGNAAPEVASGACAKTVPDVSFTAKAAYAVDLTTGKPLYADNADSQLPLASLTKLMTVATALDSLSSGDTITITPAALAPEGDAGFVVGERWKAADLVAYTLMVSANDGAHALALAASAKGGATPDTFIAGMNVKARSLGLFESYFLNDTGLDLSSTTAGAYGSARDVAALIAYLVKDHPDAIEGTRDAAGAFVSLSGLRHTAENTSFVGSELSGALAQKTGYTDLAGGNLAVVFEPLPGRPVAAVILGSTKDGRDEDMRALAETAKEALKRMLECGHAGSP